MPKFIIERNIPGAGKLDRQQLAAITQASCNVIKSIGPQIQWIESYVTDDKVYCVYIAPDEADSRLLSFLAWRRASICPLLTKEGVGGG